MPPTALATLGLLQALLGQAQKPPEQLAWSEMPAIPLDSLRPH